MKSLKVLALAAVSMLSIATVSAQRPEGGRGGNRERNPEAATEKQVEKLTKELSLSTEQATKVNALMLDFQKQMGTIQTEKEEANKKARESAKANKEQMNTDLKNILSDDQYVEYLELQLKKKDKKNPMTRGGENGAPQGDKRGKRPAAPEEE